MRQTLFAIGAALACLLAGTAATAQVTTPLSSATPEAGQAQVSLFTGFPYAITADVGLGLTRRFELSMLGRIAWQDEQRFGLEARIRLSDPTAPRGFALKIGADSWAGRPATHSDGTNPWLDATGLQDLTMWADGVYSWTTSHATVISATVGVEVVGSHKPPTTPLQGTPSFLTFGPVFTVRLAAELPLKGRLSLLFELGADFHADGFDTATVMPEVAVGLGYSF